jgi:hypothetical protein
MKKWLLYSYPAVAVVLVMALSACSGSVGDTSSTPTIAKVRIWLTLSNNPDDVHVTTLTPTQTVQASIWASGTTQENITFKVNLTYGDKLTTLATNMHTEGSIQAVAVGGFANELETGDYIFQAISGAFGSIIGSLEFTVTLAADGSTPPTTTPVSTLSEEPDRATFSIYFEDMGLGRLTGGGEVSQDLQFNVTVFAIGDQMVLYGNIIKECPQPRYEIYYVLADKAVKRGGLSFPTIEPGFDAAGFISVDNLDLPVGNYEYKVYVGNTLVGVFPFEVQ